jgi:hypothetical protein
MFQVVSDSKLIQPNIVSEIKKIKLFFYNFYFGLINYFNRTYCIKNTIPIQQQESTTETNKSSASSAQSESNTSVEEEEDQKTKQFEQSILFDKVVENEQKEAEKLTYDTTFEDQDSSLSRNNSTFYNEEDDQQKSDRDEDLKEINKSIDEMTQQVENNLTTDSSSSSS